MKMKKRLIDREAFEAAMVDAINGFVREILLSESIITNEQFERMGEIEILEKRNSLVKRVSQKWKVYTIDEGELLHDDRK